MALSSRLEEAAGWEQQGEELARARGCLKHRGSEVSCSPVPAPLYVPRREVAPRPAGVTAGGQRAGSGQWGLGQVQGEDRWRGQDERRGKGGGARWRGEGRWQHRMIVKSRWKGD